MKICVTTFCLSFLLLGAPLAHSAENSNDETPPDTLVLSDTLHYDDVKKTSTFTGNVVLTRGAMTLHSHKLVTQEDSDGEQHGTATPKEGDLVVVRQENPEKFEVLIGKGLRADYDGKKGDVTLTGQASVTRQICGEPFDNVRGARIVYHDKNGTYEAFGGQNSAAAGGRVRSLAQPQSRIDQAIARCQAKQKTARPAKPSNPAEPSGPANPATSLNPTKSSDPAKS